MRRSQHGRSEAIEIPSGPTPTFGDLALTWKPSGELTWDYRGGQPAR